MRGLINFSNLSSIYVFVLFLITINCRIYLSQNVSHSISAANNYFAINLLKELFDENENVLISPFSITAVFNMLYFGANDKTAQEIEDVLGLKLVNLTKEQIGQQYRVLLKDVTKNNSNDYELIAANHLVAQSRNPILNEYQNHLRDYFNTSIQTVDFLFKSDEAVNQINQWVSTATREKFQKLLDQPLSPLSVLVLLNAVYFKGHWKEQFLKWATKEEDFHTINKAVKVAQMKLSTQFNYTFVQQIKSQLIEIPYNDNEISMYIILPNQTDGIKMIRDNLTVNLFDEAIANLTVTTIRLILPKFLINTSYALKNNLISLGLRQAFTYKSDLSNIDGTQYLHISEMYHKVIIDVNEEGSEATTTIGGSRGLFGRYRNVQTFRADHSFAFFIRHKLSGMILFAGILNKP